MALTKIGKEGITGISNSSDATFLTATSSEGVTFAGTLGVTGASTLSGNASVGGTFSVTGVHTVGTNAVATSDGGGATTSIVQGLAKVWISAAANGASINDSFNVSSLGDNSTGVQQVNINNDMNNGGYSVAVSTGDAGAYNLATANISTGSYIGYYYNIGGSGYHDGSQKHVLTGDLA